MLQAYIKDDFKNLLEYQAWADSVVSNISQKNWLETQRFTKEETNKRIKTWPNWFPRGTTYEQLKKGVTEFIDPAIIEKVLNQVNHNISINVKDQIKAKKIRFNPNGQGVFVFDRAAMGLYRLQEYYSTVHKRTFDKSEVKESGNLYKLIADNSPITKRWEQKEDGSPKVRTTSKNVYAYYPPVKKDKLSVDIFLSVGGNSNVGAEEMLYNGISAIIVSQILEQAKIPNRISFVLGSSPDAYRSTAYGVIVPAKNYDERLDANLIALISSDPRFVRYDGFKGLVAVYDHFRASVPRALGRMMDKAAMTKAIENSTYTKEAALAPNRFYFGSTYNESAAIRLIEETLNKIAEGLT